jgi:hypothetical protein
MRGFQQCLEVGVLYTCDLLCIYMSKRAARPGHVLGPARLRRASHDTGRLRVVPGLPGVPDPRPRHGPIGIRAGRDVPLYWSAQ